MFVCGSYFSVQHIDEYLEKTGSDLSFYLLGTISVFTSLLLGIYFGKLAFKLFYRYKKITGVMLFLILGCTALLSFLCCFIVLLGAALDQSITGLCGESIINKITSPNGKFEAVIFERNCGATTAFSTHVAIVRNDSSLQQEQKRRSFFVADCDRGKAPAGPEGGPEVRLRWISNNQLEIQRHELARVIRALSMSKGIMIEYNTFITDPIY